MNNIKSIGVGALIVLLIGSVVVLMQPAKVHVEKSIVINAKPEMIKAEIESFQSFNAWSPWSKASPETRFTIVVFEGFDGTFYSDLKMEPAGDGTKVTWIYDGNNNSFKEKAMWMMRKGDLNDQYDEGLKALKEIVERKAIQ